jgi:hypothetical protein
MEGREGAPWALPLVSDSNHSSLPHHNLNVTGNEFCLGRLWRCQPTRVRNLLFFVRNLLE